MSLLADNHLDAREDTPLSRFLAHDFASDNDFQVALAFASSRLLEPAHIGGSKALQES